MNNKSKIVLYFLCLLFAGFASAGGGDIYDKYFYDVLNSKLEGKVTGKHHTMDKIFDLKKYSTNKNYLLVDLLDYYLGSASGEILGEFITSEGDKIVPLLEKKRDSQLNCLPQYQSICVDSIEHRNRRINEMLEAINKGVVLKAAE